MNPLTGDTPLHLACSGGHESTIEILLGLGADQATKNKLGQTPREVASKNKFHEISILMTKTEKNSQNDSRRGSS